MNHYRHIIWDWNGTLFDDAWLCLETMNGLLQERGLPLLTAERYQQLFDFPVIDYYRRLGFDFAAEPFVAISTEFVLAYEQRRAECQLRPEARLVLSRHQAAGRSQSILSASKQDYLDEAVDQFGLREMFGAVVGLADHHAFGKVEVGRRLVSSLGLGREEVLLVGDTLHDYEVAQALGTDCCLIPSGHQAHGRLVASGARVCPSLAAV
jgi:phosphoglycolate phosphatase